ncbi:MAG: tetratricopeptide repeat protein [Gammaproteobacteria bacterium]
MSLLLDALKKAADEKKKDSPRRENDKLDEVSSGQNQDVNLDLELEFSQQETVFPQVNEKIIKQDEENTEIAKDSGVSIENAGLENVSASDQLADVELFEDKVDVMQQAVVTDEDDTVTVGKTHNAETVQATGDGREFTNLQKSAHKIKQTLTDSGTTDSLQRENVAESERKLNQDMEALSALINKNKAVRIRSRRVISLSIISVIFILLMGASLYAYIMLEKVDSHHLDLEITENKISISDQKPQALDEAARKVIDKPERPVASASEIDHPVTNNQTAIAKPYAKRYVAKKPIRIRKKTSEDPIGVLLAQAYAAFNKSDYQASERLYNKVIIRNKNNHDALLGLAAIAQKQNRNDVAKGIYSKLLTLDPKDSYAKAGLSALISQNIALLNESQLKIMLREQPDAGHLYFALGNVLLIQKRYAEAQTAFFSAWSTDRSNTDYAFNLAVSLDHLGKAENAADFYQLSIKLFEKTGGNVSIDKIQQRINLIKGKSSG